MRFIKKMRIPFVALRYWAFGISLLFIAAGAVSLILKGGPNYGIDFTGGTMIQVKFHNVRPQPEELRGILKDILGECLIQRFGRAEDNEFLLRLAQPISQLQELSRQITQRLEKEFGTGSVDIRRLEEVGPKVGKDLRRKGILAIFWALLGILVYITWRFEFKFAVAAIMALFHDIFITVGLFSILDKEIDLSIVAALLTIAGYSINDTIVVFDRFRENLKLLRRQTYQQVMDASINQTLSRTILTSLTTLLVTVALLVLGGEVIRNFAFALTVGVVVGTYSSVFVASPIVYIWHEAAQRREKKALAQSAKLAKAGKTIPQKRGKRA